MVPADSEDPFIDIEIKQRKYPIPDAGMYQAEVIDVKVDDSPYQEGQKVMKLVLELPETYPDAEGGADRHFRIYTKPFSFMFGPRSSLSGLCNELTGRPPYFIESKEVRNGETFIHRRFNPNQFKGMKCGIVVKHANVKDKTYANIVAFMTTDAQKKQNVDSLPTASEGKDVIGAPEALARTKKEAKKEPKITEAHEAEMEKAIMSAATSIKDLIAKAASKREVQHLVELLVVDSSNLSDAEKTELKNIAQERISALESA